MPFIQSVIIWSVTFNQMAIIHRCRVSALLIEKHKCHKGFFDIHMHSVSVTLHHYAGRNKTLPTLTNYLTH